jgi:hypothetical protein
MPEVAGEQLLMKMASSGFLLNDRGSESEGPETSYRVEPFIKEVAM